MDFLKTYDTYDSLSEKQKTIIFDLSKRLDINMNVLIPHIDKLDYLSSANIKEATLAELFIEDVAYNYRKMQTLENGNIAE